MRLRLTAVLFGFTFTVGCGQTMDVAVSEVALTPIESAQAMEYAKKSGEIRFSKPERSPIAPTPQPLLGPVREPQIAEIAADDCSESETVAEHAAHLEPLAEALGQ